MLDAARQASESVGIGVGIVIAANRTRHPLDARSLARLAAQYAGRGVIGFGLSNDERRGNTADFAAAFAIAERAGLLLAPHGGELLGPAHVAACLDHLHPTRLGHGVRAAEDPDVLARVVDAGVALEVCPTSNVSLGVYSTLDEVPVRQLLDAGADVALGADDPLLFGLAAGRTVRGPARGPALHGRGVSRGSPACRSGVPARPTNSRRRRWPASTPGWLADPT